MSNIRLSKRQIQTFAGDVVSLQLLSSEDISNADIRWYTNEPDTVFIRTFRGSSEDCFSDGVLLVMLKDGDCEIFAELNGVTYSCPVNIRIRNIAYPSEKFEYFFGDFHSHSSTIHTRKEFLERDKYRPFDVLCQVKQEGILDTFVVSDHASLIDKREFFNLFLVTEALDNPDFIPFAGVESNINIIEKDIYGREQKKSGEVVTFNSAGYALCNSWEEYFEKTFHNPLAVSSFAHPQRLGYSNPTLYNFSLFEKTTPDMLNSFRMIEMGNGDDVGQNLIHELMYSVALDCGYKVAPISTGDAHRPPWGSTSSSGKTIILSPEKSREMFIDAILDARLYATENGNVKLWYTVNGYMAAQTIPLTDTYNFKVKISHFTPPSEGEKTAIIEVISDYGEIVHTEDVTPSKNINLEFTVKSDSARYFFLRLHSANGDRTWSSAIWTGRESDPCPVSHSDFIRLDKSRMQIISCSEGAAPQLIINGDPENAWTSNKSTAEFVIDIAQNENICAVGYWPHPISRTNPDCSETEGCARFVSEYECYVSNDNFNYRKVASGSIRCFGGEQKITFDAVNARYVKIKIPSSTGSSSHKPRYKNSPVMIGEIDIYKK